MDYSQVFSDRYNQLNEQQKLAVDTIDGPVLVVAGPGSGKTELLSLRVANIIRSTDTSPREILCLTFTDAASINMRKRLLSLIGPEAHQINIHTFHSLGEEIISQNPHFFYQGARYNTADEIIKVKIIEEILKKSKYDSQLKSYNPRQGYTYMNSINQSIGELKKAGISPSTFKEILKQSQSELTNITPIIIPLFNERISKKIIEKAAATLLELQAVTHSEHSITAHYIDTFTQAVAEAQETGKTVPITNFKKKYITKNHLGEFYLKDEDNILKNLELADIYQHYQDQLQKECYHDFDDMIITTINTISENPELRFNLQEKYQYILIDEFQDTNSSQIQLVDQLINMEISNNRPNILAVGDDDQAIYKFQGANLSNIQDFKNKYLDTATIVLTDNYRSHQDILDLSRSVITQGSERLENLYPNEIKKDLIAKNKTIATCNIIEKLFPTSLQEYDFIAKEIRALKENGHNLDEIAIISSKHASLESIVPYLNHYEIPIEYDRKNNVLQDQKIKEIITIIKFILTINKATLLPSEHLLPEILSFPFYQIPSLEIWKLSLAAKKNHNSWLENMIEGENTKIRDIAKFLIELSGKAHHSTAEEIIDYITGVTELQLDETTTYKNPYKDHYFDTSDIEDNTEYFSFLLNLRAFINKIRTHQNTKTLYAEDVVELTELYETHHKELSVTSYIKPTTASVKILSAHKAKGMEFETVFILHSQEQPWIKRNGSSNISFPSHLKLKPEKDNHDDILRLYFVAITRAKSNLYMTRYQYNDKGEEDLPLYFLSNFETKDKKKSAIHNAKVTQYNNEYAEENDLIELLEKVTPKEVKNELTGDHRAIFNNLLSTYQLSITHLNNFIDLSYAGPKKFLEQNLLQFPQKPSPHNAYGSAIHDALDKLQNKLTKTHQLEPLPELLQDFETALQNQHLNRQDFDHLLLKGQEQLTKYYQEKGPSFSPSDKSEFNFRTQNVVVKNANLTGKIDRMSINENDKTIAVYDYKTGKALTSWQGKDDSAKIKSLKIKNQLIFYKLLVENSRVFKDKYRVEKGIIEFIEPYKDQLITLEHTITTEDINRLANLASIVYQKVLNLDFPDTSHYGTSYKDIQAFIDDLLSGNI
ncbi:hypothetical protein CVV38_03955 [Candidatus Peregrinibacteria bacterium HGW-Peregrinibacteria-1]|jgi:DNA helicase-2/ATP-dependent DNA helicase PcrA|nr:MAG: hypothetical protein CVV38_03955 [Candidatus Peregrinibacteria bacterium HGW-Peregrinibacteria-1]